MTTSDSETNRMRSLRRPPMWMALIPTVWAGCAPGPATVPVTGVVRYRGEPLAGATLIFRAPNPDAPKRALLGTATTDAAGRFAVTTQFGAGTVKRGALVGKHVVIVSKYVPPDGMTESRYQELLDREGKAVAERGMATDAERAPPRVELLPARFSNPASTTLTATVTSGAANDLTFDLQDR